MKRIIRFLFSRATAAALLIILQIAVIAFAILYFSSNFVYFYTISTVLAVVMIIYIVGSRDNPSYKLAWAITILIFPVLGAPLYLMFGGRGVTRRFMKRMALIMERSLPYLTQDKEVLKDLEKGDRDAVLQSKYLSEKALLPVYKNEFLEYLSPGEKMFERLKEELEKARHFIFLEYFIIEPGRMWGEVHDILLKKAEQGVDVRMLYDDLGSISTLPHGYDKALTKEGIRCYTVNHVKPLLSGKTNNRDHRKITVIDGHTAFTGGINLADEYINEAQKYGHWKDASVMLRGPAVNSFTVMFLQMWEYYSKEPVDYARFLPEHEWEKGGEGFVQPFDDSPYNDEAIAECAFINMISRAKEYVYINSPYLIIDNEIMTALALAAKSGVDVRIVCPGIGDKWFVHETTRSYYKQLVLEGVRIYEYTPGFMHSKTMMADGKIAIVGSINMDYRSLFLHFECGVWMYNVPAIDDIKQDFLKTLEVCKEISKDQKVNWLRSMVRSVLRVFAPMM